MSKEIWELEITTSLPEVAYSSDDLKRNTYSFENFEAAKKVLREKLKEFSLGENDMFYGEGRLNYLDCLIDELHDWEEESDDALTVSKLNSIQEALLGIFKGENKPIELKEVKNCSNWMICADIGKDYIKIYGSPEGCLNGYIGNVQTNMFDMTEEKDYYLYINDMFGQEVSSELYIDLVKKVKLD